MVSGGEDTVFTAKVGGLVPVVLRMDSEGRGVYFYLCPPFSSFLNSFLYNLPPTFTFPSLKRLFTKFSKLHSRFG